ncbi:hypothetical protein HY501_02530 [Candidatus Woesearchaeota archaeon]|nr:hypothetical protein [Candidatus Woesearchaeota archaeon]
MDDLERVTRREALWRFARMALGGAVAVALPSLAAPAEARKAEEPYPTETCHERYHRVKAMKRKMRNSDYVGCTLKNLHLPRYLGNNAFSEPEPIFGNHNVVLITVYFNGCGPCYEEVPILNRIQQKYHDKGVGIAAINCSLTEIAEDGGVQDGVTSEEVFRAFFHHAGHEPLYPNYKDVHDKNDIRGKDRYGYQASNEFNLSGAPTNIVIVPQGEFGIVVGRRNITTYRELYQLISQGLVMVEQKKKEGKKKE